MSTAYLFTGFPASGKTAIASVLSEEMDVEMFEMGDVVRQRVASHLDKPVSKLTSKELSTTANVLREIHGQSVYAEEVFCNMDDYGPAIVSGVRSPESVDCFKELFDSVIIISVEAPTEIRLERIEERARDGEESFTKDDLLERDKDEIDRGVHSTMALADIHVTNTADLETSVKTTAQEVKNLGFKP